MKRILSNGPDRDFVMAAVQKLTAGSTAIFFAAPYFNRADVVVEAAKAGKRVQLLIGLNSATRPEAVEEVVATAGVSVRYLTRRFHAKIYLFDNAALLGSANITNAGLMENREAVICLDRDEDQTSVEETKALFAELWESAAVVTPDVAKKFAAAWRQFQTKGPDPDASIEQAVGKASRPTSTWKVGKLVANACSWKGFAARFTSSTSQHFPKLRRCFRARTCVGRNSRGSTLRSRQIVF